ncbi:hypothetical protein CEUSTIGMA_g2017.t1 [Chlamydomonas eustigma]|uniref:Glutathione reductase n=1 Tax=Chlamydomonas eustigma TaxID=1157962 RepID=A0A250WUS2_9CHLO|nr:hypothetical protein CEUSTIGMA_g2017.t1 [Chlamydomonas eustigma]|eukprot:GAX74568.1 hypothetical protein CEUSTIGMA_g2017.t1 [Chlamydomonas eustigma]
MTDQFDYDLITLGAGSGGVRASRFSAQLYGAKVAVVELPFGFISSDDIGGAGGTCVIRGCVPKKLLVYSSQFSDEFSDAKGFGWAINKGTHSWAELIGNKGKEIQRLNGVYNNILKGAGVTSIEGRGFIVDPHTIEIRLVDGTSQKLRAKNILVAVGGYPSKLQIEGADLAITSDEALALESLPVGPVAVLGAGYIACEFAGIFNGVGSEVNLMFRGDQVLRGFDNECRGQVQENLGKRGVKLHPHSTPVRISRGGAFGYILHYLTQGDAVVKQLECGLVMMATGRKPRTYALGLDKVGVELDSEGAIKVDEYSRTNVPSIWAIGDVTNRINLTPVALMEGMAFAKTCFTGELTKPDYDFVPSAVFSQPPLASVGYSEEEAMAQLGGDLDVYVSKFKPMKYTISGRDEKTLMKLIVHAETDRVVGCHMVGPDAPEIMQGIAIALKAGATKKTFDSTIGIHPSAAEEFVTMRSKSRTVKGVGSAKL